MYLHSASEFSPSSALCGSFVKFSNGRMLSVELRRTAAERATGMQRRRIPVPMLFLHGNTARHRYHMRNVPMPLDLLELDCSGMILNWMTMKPGSAAVYGRTRHAIALELPAGMAARNNLKPGDRIALLPMTCMG